jgi:DNA invertase Pin-like site-specific DNA recombinase
MQDAIGSFCRANSMFGMEERRMISKRTKNALAAEKRRGTKLDGGMVPRGKARGLAREVPRRRPLELVDGLEL